MISVEDTSLSKTSYCSKDFGSIYPELLDLASKISPNWDPSLSNESDPGVVLLKSAAFVADHLNYNIDKNILEAMLPSATQDSSVRNIMEVNGYQPRYYVSAVGTITVGYNEPEGGTFTPENFPAFSLTISDTDSNITYTQLDGLSISEDGVNTTCRFIEGTVNTLNSPGDNTTVTITQLDLDSEYKIYFPVSNVAQNGVFIYNSDGTKLDGWNRVEYLSTIPLGSKVYKIGYDSYTLKPYIKFPSDIATIIGDGIVIRYITTLGTGGNIKAGYLTKVTSVGTSEKSADNFNVSNNLSILSGQDPEGIDEMYESFIKTVGTFNTLVTREDYSNAVRNLVDDTSTNLVSNAVVTDRTNDYNKILNIQSMDLYGKKTINTSFADIPVYNLRTSTPQTPAKGDVCVIDNQFKYYDGSNWKVISSIDSSNLDEGMTAFDLAIHALNKYNKSYYSSIIPDYAMRTSFEPVTGQQLETIQSKIYDNNKCIVHQFNNDEVGDLVCFKNYITPRITIVPYSKVTETAAAEIINNVMHALSDNFNASKVTFGEELNYDEVLRVIEGADTNIKSAKLEDFEYETKGDYITSAGHEEHSLLEVVSNNYPYLEDLIAKNVLAGKVCLFEFDDSIETRYGQTGANIISNVSKITTETAIPVDQASLSPQSAVTTLVQSTPVDSGLKLKLSSGTLTLTAGQTTILTGETQLIITNGSVVSTYANEGSTTYGVKNSGSSNVSLSTSDYTVTSSDSLTLVSTTNNSVLLQDPTVAYTLGKNEIVNICFPTYIEKDIYPQYTNYRFVPATPSTVVHANIEYTLAAGDRLIMNLTSDGVEETNVYTSGTVIKTSFEMSATPNTGGITKTYNVGTTRYTENFAMLGSGEQISVLAIKEYEVISPAVQCTWIMNNSTNTLFSPDESTKFLDNNEYFIYKNISTGSNAILGAGTILTRGSATTSAEWSTKKPTLEDIYSGNNDFWVTKDFSLTNSELKITFTSLLTLAEGSSFRIYNWSATPGSTIGNDWISLGQSALISYTIDGVESTLGNVPGGPKIRSRLILTTSGDTYQELVSGHQQVVLKNSSGSVLGTITSGSILTSELMSTLNLGYAEFDEPISVKTFTFVSPTQKVGTSSPTNMTKSSNNYIGSVDSTAQVVYTLKVSCKKSESDKLLIPIYLDVTGSIGATNTITATYGSPATSINVKDFISGDVVSGLTAGLNNLTLASAGQSGDEIDITITVTLVAASDSVLNILFMPVKIHNGINKNFFVNTDLSSTVTLARVTAKIKELLNKCIDRGIQPVLFEYPDNSIAIQDEDFTNANIMWDVNNVANVITIPRMKISNSDYNIDIYKSMRDYK